MIYNFYFSKDSFQLPIIQYQQSVFMEYLRKGMRIAGRIAISILFLVFFLAAYTSQQSLHNHYLQKWDPFRFLLYQKRIVNLPPAKYIQGLFQYFYIFDLAYGAITGLLILLGMRFGGFMMFLWYLGKIAVYYLPHLFDMPRQPFKINDRFEMMRQFALLGVGLALCRSLPKKILKQKQQPIFSGAQK